MNESPPTFDRAARLVMALSLVVALVFSTGMALAFEIALDAPVVVHG